jgi:hypothetical protein
VGPAARFVRRRDVFRAAADEGSLLGRCALAVITLMPWRKTD